MNQKEISKPSLQRLKGMIGKLFLYKGKQIKIKDYHVLGEEGKTQIDIEEGEPIKTADITKFIEFCLPVDDTNGEEKQESGVSTVVLQETNTLIGTLQQTLLENIAQVKKNPNYIKQANVINSSVNALIGMAKLQLQVGKMNGGKK
jgi:hypothetical protein